MHGDDVGLPFNHKHSVFFCYGSLGLPDTVKLVVLMKDVAVVFLVDAFCAAVEHTGREAHHLSAHANPGKDHATGITVDQLTTVVAVADARFEQILFFIAFLQSDTGQGMSVRDVEAQLELPDDVVAEATAAEILHADSHTVGMVVEQVLEIL